MAQSDQFFTPVQRVDSPGYSAGNSMDSHPGQTQSAEPGYSIASIEPAHGGPRGPTPPPRTDIRSPPTSRLHSCLYPGVHMLDQSLSV